MDNVYLQDSTLTAIGDAIRAKAGNSDLLLPSEMPNAITNLPSGSGAEKVKAPLISFDSTGAKISLDNGWTLQNIPLKTIEADRMSLSILGVSSYEELVEKVFSIQFHCRPLYYTNYSLDTNIPDKKARLLLYPYLANFIDSPVTQLKNFIPAILARTSTSSSTTETIDANTYLQEDLFHGGYSGNYIPCMGVVSGSAIYVYSFNIDGETKNLFNSTNKISDSNSVIVWRK